MSKLLYQKLFKLWQGFFDILSHQTETETGLDFIVTAQDIGVQGQLEFNNENLSFNISRSFKDDSIDLCISDGKYKMLLSVNSYGNVYLSEDISKDVTAEVIQDMLNIFEQIVNGYMRYLEKCNYEDYRSSYYTNKVIKDLEKLYA